MSIVDAALGGPYDAIGEAIVAAGETDASGARRAAAQLLKQPDYERLKSWLKLDRRAVDRLRALCVRHWGEPKPEVGS